MAEEKMILFNFDERTSNPTSKAKTKGKIHPKKV